MSQWQTGEAWHQYVEAKAAYDAADAAIREFSEAAKTMETAKVAWLASQITRRPPTTVQRGPDGALEVRLVS